MFLIVMCCSNDSKREILHVVVVDALVVVVDSTYVVVWVGCGVVVVVGIIVVVVTETCSGRNVTNRDTC